MQYFNDVEWLDNGNGLYDEDGRVRQQLPTLVREA